MRNPWIVNWHYTYGEKEWDKIDMPDYLPVTIYADTTGQYSEEEIEEMNGVWGQMIEIPVPKELLIQWWFDCLEFDRDPEFNEEPDDGWPECTEEDFWRWFNDESTADDADSLYDWLVAYNYCWKRLD